MSKILLTIATLLCIFHQGISQTRNPASEKFHGLWLGVMEVTEQMKLKLALKLNPTLPGIYQRK